MCKNLYKNLLISMFFLTNCERYALSPVEIKIDNDLGGYLPVAEINNTYTVKDNETLFDVANKFNIDPMSLAALNDIKAPYKVKNGQVLKLPMEENNSVLSNNAYDSVQIDESKNIKNDDLKKDELDERFNKIMYDKKGEKSKEQSDDNAVAYGKKSSFNEQEAELSSPKVTKTAKGVEISANHVSDVKATKAAVNNREMIWPVKGNVSSKFGDMFDGLPNDGINIKAAAGTKVCAVSDGEVLYAGNNLDESFGNVVVVKHDKGLISSYANMGNILVKKGAKINQGTVVGTVGKTGNVNEPQLHFEIMKDSTPLNPEKYLGK